LSVDMNVMLCWAISDWPPSYHELMEEEIYRKDMKSASPGQLPYSLEALTDTAMWCIEQSDVSRCLVIFYLASYSWGISKNVCMLRVSKNCCQIVKVIYLDLIPFTSQVFNAYHRPRRVLQSATETRKSCVIHHPSPQRLYRWLTVK
jgi:hypothetical protein